MMGIVVPETCWASNKICNKNLCAGTLFSYINDDVRSKSHQILFFLFILVSKLTCVALSLHATEAFTSRREKFIFYLCIHMYEGHCLC